jgi:hypothetical protein
MPDSKPTQTARGWLQTGQAPKDRVTEVARAGALLSGQIPLIPAALAPALQADVEMALLVEADVRGMLGLVDLLAEHAANKAVTKHARKVLFRAKQRGIAVPERVQVRAPVSLAARPEPLPSYASTFDTDGNQLLMMGGWAAAEGSWCLAGFVHDTDGLHSVYFMPHLSRTAHREIVDKMRGSFNGEVLEVPGPFAASRLRWGTDRRDARQVGWEGDQADARRILTDVEPLGEIEFNLDAEDEALLAAHLDSADVECAVTAELLEARALRKAVVATLGGQIRAVAGDEAKAQALTEALEQWLESWFDAERRANYAGRLEIEAWLRHQLGEREAMLRTLSLARLMRDMQRSVLAAPVFAHTVRQRLTPGVLVALQMAAEMGGK